jgi:hypothetical protein
MKKITALLIVCALAAIAYTAYWFTAANYAEEQFLKALAQWHEQQGNDTKISYQSLTKEGFPTHVTLNLHQPELTSPSSADQPWQLHTNIDGSLKLGGSLLSNERSASINGTQYAVLSKPNEARTIKLQWEGDISVNGTPQRNISHFEQLKDLVDETVKSVDPSAEWPETLNLNVDVKNALVTFSEQDRTLMTLQTGPAVINIEKTGSVDEVQKVTYNFDLKELQIDHDRSDWPENTLEAAYLKHLSWDPQSLGKKVDIQADGMLCFPSPHAWQAIQEKPWQPRDTRFCLTIDQGSINSSWGKQTTKDFVLDLEQKQSTYIFKADSKTEAYYTPAYDAMLAKKLLYFLRSPGFLKEFISEDHVEQEQFSKHVPELVVLLPRLHTWGNMSSTVDFSAKVDVDYADLGEDKGGETLGVKDISINLATLESRINPYTLTINAQFNSNRDLKKAEGNLNLFLSNYKQLIQQILAYNNHVSRVLRKIDIPNLPRLPIFKAEHGEHIISFVKALSETEEDQESDDLVIKASEEDENGLKVGRLNIYEIIQKSAELGNNLQSAF